MKITDVTYVGNLVQITGDGGEWFIVEAEGGLISLFYVGDELTPDSLPVLRILDQHNEPHLYRTLAGTHILKEIK